MMHGGKRGSTTTQEHFNRSLLLLPTLMCTYILHTEIAVQHILHTLIDTWHLFVAVYAAIADSLWHMQLLAIRGVDTLSGCHNM
ncbi:hypothetical protein F4808DRAFT_412883, partial [Astrocystis sublimbata]